LIVRALFTLIVIFLAYKLYQRLFQQKRCVACSKMIFKEAAICHYCNTIQDGVELMQVKAETARPTPDNRERQTRGYFQPMFLLIGAVALIVLSVGIAVWLMQFQAG